MSAYQHVCSLGPFCHASDLLKRLKVKRESYPFDWTCTALEMIMHCIEDDFTIFLDRSYYVSDPSNDVTRHTYYENRFRQSSGSFSHIPEMTDEKYQYFVRCVERFRKLLKSPMRKLFVIANMVTYTEVVDPDYREKTIKFYEFLKKYTTNFDILCIIHTPNKPHFSYNTTVQDGIYFMHLETQSISHGVFLLDETENLFLCDVIKRHIMFDVKSLE